MLEARLLSDDANASGTPASFARRHFLQRSRSGEGHAPGAASSEMILSGYRQFRYVQFARDAAVWLRSDLFLNNNRLPRLSPPVDHCNAMFTGFGINYTHLSKAKMRFKIDITADITLASLRALIRRVLYIPSARHDDALPRRVACAPDAYLIYRAAAVYFDAFAIEAAAQRARHTTMLFGQVVTHAARARDGRFSDE